MDDLPAVEPVKIYENTYAMPHLAERFKKSSAEKIMQDVLVQKLEFTNERDKKGRLAWSYDADECAELSRDITQECLEKIKADNGGGMPRFKLICQVSVGENNGQSLRMASRCLWDVEIDNCASSTWTNNRVYAVATCFALYYE